MAQEVKTKITRGGSTVSAYNSEGKEITTHQKAEQHTEDKVVKAFTMSPSELDLVGNVKLILRNGAMISYTTAASCIVGEIRRIYFTSINRPDSYDIQILNYMDKILFNNLTDIIEGIMRYGSGCFPKDIIIQTIKDVVDIMEVQPNLSAIHNIINRLYIEF